VKHTKLPASSTQGVSGRVSHGLGLPVPVEDFRIPEEEKARPDQRLN
jgi:hypothetical protein